MQTERTCGNCCFGLKDLRAREKVRFCAMSKDREMRFDTTLAAELKCKKHLFRAKKEDGK